MREFERDGTSREFERHRAREKPASARREDVWWWTSMADLSPSNTSSTRLRWWVLGAAAVAGVAATVVVVRSTRRRKRNVQKRTEAVERVAQEVGRDTQAHVREQVRMALRKKLDQARESLVLHWEQGIETEPVAKETNDGEARGTWGEGFAGWWLSAPASVKMALVQSARELVRARIAGMEGGEAGSMALDVLCPEFADQRLEKLCNGDVLPKLYVARIHQNEATRVHDLAYVRANVEGEATEDELQVTVDNRQLLVYTVLTDILIVFKHMAMGT